MEMQIVDDSCRRVIFRVYTKKLSNIFHFMTALAVNVSTGNPGSVKPISARFALGGPGRLQRWQLFLY